MDRFLEAAEIQIDINRGLRSSENERNVSPSDAVCLALREINLTTPHLDYTTAMEPLARTVALDLRNSLLQTANEILKEDRIEDHLSVRPETWDLIDAQNIATKVFIEGHRVIGDFGHLNSPTHRRPYTETTEKPRLDATRILAETLQSEGLKYRAVLDELRSWNAKVTEARDYHNERANNLERKLSLSLQTKTPAKSMLQNFYQRIGNKKRL